MREPASAQQICVLRIMQEGLKAQMNAGRFLGYGLSDQRNEILTLCISGENPSE